MSDLEQFRADTRAWLAANCPPGARGPGQVCNGSSKIEIRDPDVTLWLNRMAEKGWTVPTWPKEYGGGGLNTAEYIILLEEMRAIKARPPLVNRGTSMVGPTLLEVGSEDQKKRHLPSIARGEGEWCQGYSEPGAGSDLASLRTLAVLDGDHFVINGQKTWTSDAATSDWMFLLVRTDPDVPKHEGISFLLMSMDQPGITTTPIRMISGSSPFSETFFDDAFADKNDLIGGLNQGWSVGKRLLQHERSGMESLISGSAGVRPAGLVDTARNFFGDNNGRIKDPAVRDDVLQYEMNMRALQLTQRRTVEESTDGKTPGPATSIFKTVGTELEKRHAELMTTLRGTQGCGWEGEGFSDEEIAATRRFLASRAASIYSGSNEIQRNIIAKRVLGLPD